jgi:hypothetical protein
MRLPDWTFPAAIAAFVIGLLVLLVVIGGPQPEEPLPCSTTCQQQQETP